MRQLALFSLLLGSVLVLPAARAQSLGSVDFPTSTASADAQAAFERGLLLLHSFEYDDARDAFRDAHQIDPAFALAAWGEAMTHNRPIWMQQDRAEGQRALARVDGDLDGITDRERGYLRTARVLFGGEGDKEARDDAYERAMAELAAAYPDDLDAQALWALAILGTAHEGRDFAVYMRAAAVLEGVFARNPEHPGAAHYLIHAYDDAVHAPLGLRPARVYADVAPDASHALHMPSHIYLALGLWDETADLNRRSFEAARANSERRGEPLNNHGWHALYWLNYAALQQGDLEGAFGTLGLARRLAGDDPSVLARTHLVRIRAHMLAETGRFDDASLRFEVDLDGASATTRAIELASRVSLAGTDAAARRAPLDALRALADAPDASPTVRAIRLVQDALLADAEGDLGAAEAHLREAAALVEAEPLTFGPPTPALPPHEMLGLWLAKNDRTDEASEAFATQLALTPGRPLSAQFLARIANASRTEFEGARAEHP